jgi:hypothetical protein
MGCNCGKKRLMQGQTSANVTASNVPASAPDRPDIAAAKTAAQNRVNAAQATVQDS